MDNRDYHSAYWKKIENGESPYFDIVKVLIQILKEETGRGVYSGYDGDFYRTITKNELANKMEENKIEVTPHAIGRAVTSFLKYKELPYTKTGRGYQEITYNREIIEELEEWIKNTTKGKKK